MNNKCRSHGNTLSILCNINEIPDVFLSPKIKGIILKLETEYTLKENKMLFE